MPTGVMKEKQGDRYTIRILSVGGRVPSTHLKRIADLAERFAEGIVHLTVRQTIEIPGVPADRLDALVLELGEAGIELGLTGRRVRGITSCPGAPRCRYCQANAQDMAARLHERVGRRDGLPSKFKIGISGCPNGCTKPVENDLGLVGTARGFRLLVGGKMGRHPCLGTPVPMDPLPPEAVPDATARILDWYVEHGQEKERFGDAIERVGMASLARCITDGQQ